ncbi:MAG: sugar-binding protein, partial [Armatimonadota bacterium]
MQFSAYRCAPYRVLPRSLLIAALLAFALMLPSAGWALRLPEAKPAPRVQVHTLWNPDYICLSAKVPDTMLTGSSVSPMSAPQQDDAIEFDFEVAVATGREAHRLIISCAGGMTVLLRDASGRWRPDPSWITGTQTVKYAVSIEGTLNNPADVDTGYTVECAIPWKFLGGEAPVSKEIGFNVICWQQGENEGPVSWSQTVTSEQEAGDSGRWGRMLIAPNSTLATAEGNWIPCPFGRMPFIDGKLTAEKWMTASTLMFDLPQPKVAPVTTAAKQADVIGTLLAIYRYDWQGDPLRPGAHLWLAGGAPSTSDQPREAAGPWYSWERVAWHRSQLNEIQRGGIDIVMAKYRGDDEARRTWARTGLDRLSEALKQMRAEGRSYPLVGMMLDTAPLAGVDLKSDEGKRLVYGMIRDFYLHVSREFWAEIGLRPRQAGGGAPVLLGEPDALADWDGSFLAYAQERFSHDFDGAKLVWLGSSQWRTRGAEGFYAYVRLPGTVGVTQEGAGGASTMAVSPGYCPPPGTIADVRPRRDGRAYRSDWQRVLATSPELVVLNSWNDFADANELAPSRQYGVTFVDMTRYFAARMGSKQPHAVRLKKQAVPDVLLPGTDYRVELLLENVGTKDLSTGRRITADFRIVRRPDGKVMLSKVGAQDLSIMAGQTLRVPVVISTKDDRGNPLAPGEYLFSLVAMRSSLAYLRSELFAKPMAELTVPFTVGTPPARRFTVVSTSLPSTIESGGSEQVVVRIRNDGAAVWRAASTALSYRWLKHDDDLGSSNAEAVLCDGPRARLPKDVPPGEIVSIVIPVAATQPDGSALTPARDGDLWHYRVQWNLVDKDGWFPNDSARSEALAIIATDRGVHFDSAATPTEMQAGKRGAVDVVVGNAGQRPWKAA